MRGFNLTGSKSILIQVTSKTYVTKNRDVLNVAFYKSKKQKNLLSMVVCKLIFSPPYLPELKQTEKFWTNMKRV